jgi:hypothetical protein
MIGYKIVKITDTADEYKTLFHAIEGSKTMRAGRWLKASVKRVRDGSGGTYYDSGIHVLPSLSEALRYMENFKDVFDKTIVRVECKNSRVKGHSRSSVLLCDEIKIIDEVWVI